LPRCRFGGTRVAFAGKTRFELFANELLNVDSENNLMVLKGLEEFSRTPGRPAHLTLLKGIGQGFEVHTMKCTQGDRVDLRAARDATSRRRGTLSTPRRGISILPEATQSRRPMAD